MGLVSRSSEREGRRRGQLRHGCCVLVRGFASRNSILGCAHAQWRWFFLLPKLQPMPAVIFVTAYDRFAVRAFEANAVDYLLKPIRSERLDDALQRIFHRPRPLQVGPTPTIKSSPLRLKNGLVFVAQITAIEANANHTRIHLADRSSTFVRRGITEWETLLLKPFFLRADARLSCASRPSGRL